MEKVKILKTEITPVTAGELKAKIGSLLVGAHQRKIGKVNTEFLLRALSVDMFCDTLNNCDYNIADGKGVLWAAKYLSLPLTKIPFLRQIQSIWQMVYSGASLIFYPKYCRKPIPANIPGIDALYLMLEAAEDAGEGVYFFGAEEGVLPKAIKELRKKLPKLKVSGFHHGFDYKDKEIVADINKSKAKLLIVAMGSPKQEYWIRDNLDKLETVRVAVGEGGSLDRIANPSEKAPKWMQQASLEWLWRLFTGKNRTGEPGKRAKSRLGRIWNAVPVFIFNVVKFKLGDREIRN